MDKHTELGSCMLLLSTRNQYVHPVIGMLRAANSAIRRIQNPGRSSSDMGNVEDWSKEISGALEKVLVSFGSVEFTLGIRRIEEPGTLEEGEVADRDYRPVVLREHFRDADGVFMLPDPTSPGSLTDHLTNAQAWCILAGFFDPKTMHKVRRVHVVIDDGTGYEEYTTIAIEMHGVVLDEGRFIETTGGRLVRPK